MNEAETLVRSYLAAIATRDFDLARTYLADRDFSYISPIDSFKDAGSFIHRLSAIGPILDRLNIRKCVVSSNEIIVIVDITINLSGYVSYPTAMLFDIADGRIKSIESIFDASDYHRLFAIDD